MIRLKYILSIMLLAVAFGATGQSYVIDNVKVGTESHYRIDGEANSTYTWTLTDPSGNVKTLPETSDTVTIKWHMPTGDYILSTLQTSAQGCSSLELGIIHVFIPPDTMMRKVELMAGVAHGCINSQLEIPVLANDFNNISAFKIQLSFDPAILAFNGLTHQNNQLAKGIIDWTLVSPGNLQISFNSNDTLNLVDKEQLLSLSFTGLSSGKSEIKWNHLQCVIYSKYKSEIPAIYSKGSAYILPEPQIYIDGNGGYCENTPHKLTAGSFTNQNLSYEWTSPDGSKKTGSELDLGPLGLAATGEYLVKVSGREVCSITDTLNLQVYPNPHVSLESHDSLCSGNGVMLNPGSGFASYKWQDGSTQPQLNATSEGLYWVSVTDNNGCEANASIQVNLCELMIFMPNVFTPNHDGVNDIFLPIYNPDIPFTFQMQIFNKWGELLFTTNDVAEGWNGIYKGALCTEDVYTWVITFSAPENYRFIQKSPMRGNVMLLK